MVKINGKEVEWEKVNSKEVEWEKAPNFVNDIRRKILWRDERLERLSLSCVLRKGYILNKSLTVTLMRISLLLIYLVG